MRRISEPRIEKNSVMKLLHHKINIIGHNITAHHLELFLFIEGDNYLIFCILLLRHVFKSSHEEMHNDFRKRERWGGRMRERERD